MLKKSKWIKVFCMLTMLICVLCACGTEESSLEPTIITSEEEISTMIKEAVEEKEYDLTKFANVDSKMLNSLLVEDFKTTIPEEIEIDYFTDYDWSKAVRHCEIAEASNMTDEQKNVFRDYSTLVESALVSFHELEEVYESYAGIALPGDDYKKFEIGREEMFSIKNDYDNAMYYSFYVRNALNNSTLGKITDVLSGDGDVNYYYANDVVDAGLLGEWWGDKHYCIVTKDTFPESGVYTLLVYQPEYIELEDENGFVIEATICVVITEEEIATFNEKFYECEEKEKLIYDTLRQAQKLVLEETEIQTLENEEQMLTAENNNTPQKVTTGYEDNFTGSYKAEYENVEIIITAASDTEYYLTYKASGITLKDVPCAYKTASGNGLMFFVDDYYPEHAGYVEVIYDDVIGFSYNAELNGIEGTTGTYSPLE